MKKAFPEGAGDKWAKWARKSWEDMRLENQTFRSIFGFDFDRGHWIPSAWGGPNTKRNASAEAARDYINKYGRFIFGNRDKGDMPNLSTMHAHRELGGSATWLQDFIEWQLDQEGLNANQLPESHWLRHGQNALVQDTILTPSEFDKIKNVDDLGRETGLKQQQVARRQLAINQKRLDVLNQEREFFNTLFEAGLIPPEDVPLIEKQLNQITTGEWYNRDETFGKYGSAAKAGYKRRVNNKVIDAARKLPKNQFLQIYKNINNASNLIPTPVKRAAIVGGALLPGALGTTASAFEVIERGEKYEKTKNWLDGIQLGLANASLFTGWSGVGEIIATPADLLNLGLDAARFGTRPSSEMDMAARRAASRGTN